MPERKFLAGLQITTLGKDLVSPEGHVLGNAGDTIILLPQTLAECVQFSEGTSLPEVRKKVLQSITDLAAELVTCTNRITDTELALVEYSTLLVRQANSITEARAHLASLAAEISAKSATSVTVISDPEFSLATHTENTGSLSFAVTATSLLSGGTIDKFYLTVPELDIKNREFAATEGSAEISVNTFSWMANQLLHISLTAEDNFKNSSRIARGFTTLIISGVQPAEIIAPFDGECVDALTASISLAPMDVFGDIGDQAKYVRVQVAKDAEFTQIIFDNGTASAPTETNIEPVGGLEPGISCFARARWTGEFLGDGPWSRTVQFSTNAE